MPVLAISSVILWILQIAIIIVLVGLARQVGLLHLRLGPMGPGPAEGGPTVGTQFELKPLTSLRGIAIAPVLPGHISLIAFANPACSACAPTMKALTRLRSVEQDIHTIVAIEGDQPSILRYAETYGLSDVATEAGALQHLAATQRPFATVLSDDGTVLASGIPNTVEQIELLLAAARDRASRLSQLSERDSTTLAQPNAHTVTDVQLGPLIPSDEPSGDQQATLKGSTSHV